MQSFLNVITLQTYTFFITLTPRLHGRSKHFFRRPQNLNAPRNSLMTRSCYAVTQDSVSGLASHSYPGEVLPVDDMQAHTEVEIQLHQFFPLALDRSEWLFQAPATLLSGRSTGNHRLHAGWAQNCSGRFGDRTSLSKLAGCRTVIPRSSGPQPIYSLRHFCHPRHGGVQYLSVPEHTQ